MCSQSWLLILSYVSVWTEWSFVKFYTGWLSLRFVENISFFFYIGQKQQTYNMKTYPHLWLLWLFNVTMVSLLIFWFSLQLCKCITSVLLCGLLLDCISLTEIQSHATGDLFMLSYKPAYQHNLLPTFDEVWVPLDLRTPQGTPCT